MHPTIESLATRLKTLWAKTEPQRQDPVFVSKVGIALVATGLVFSFSSEESTPAFNEADYKPTATAAPNQPVSKPKVTPAALPTSLSMKCSTGAATFTISGDDRYLELAGSRVRQSHRVSIFDPAKEQIVAMTSNDASNPIYSLYDFKNLRVSHNDGQGPRTGFEVNRTIRCYKS